jgi:hypothetical protein
LARDQADRIWFWAKAGLDEDAILATAETLRKGRVKESTALEETGDVVLIPRYRQTRQGREETGPLVPLPREFIPNPDSTVCFVVDAKATAVVDSPKAVFILDESEKDAPSVLPFWKQVVFVEYNPEIGSKPDPDARPGIHMGRIGLVPPFELTADMTLWVFARFHSLTERQAAPSITVGSFRYSAQNELAGIDPNRIDSNFDPRVVSTRAKVRDLALKELKLDAGWSILGRVLGRLKLAGVENV